MLWWSPASSTIKKGQQRQAVLGVVWNRHKAGCMAEEGALQPSLNLVAILHHCSAVWAAAHFFHLFSFLKKYCFKKKGAEGAGGCSEGSEAMWDHEGEGWQYNPLPDTPVLQPCEVVG